MSLRDRLRLRERTQWRRPVFGANGRGEIQTFDPLKRENLRLLTLHCPRQDFERFC